MQGRDRHAAEAAASEVVFLAAYLMMRRMISQIGIAGQELRLWNVSVGISELRFLARAVLK